MKTVAFVPIKLNNERLPHKNMLSLSHGYPLFHYILETLKSCQSIDETYVFCSTEISNILPEGVTLIRRDPSLDSSAATANDLVAAFAQAIPADFYVMTHATSPMISSTSIQRGLQAVYSGRYDSALSVQKVQDFLWQMDTPLNYDPADTPRTQDLPLLYQETCGFYIFTKQLALEHHRRVGFRPCKIEVSPIEALDIDEQQDFWIADAVHKYVKEKNLKYVFEQ